MRNALFFLLFATASCPAPALATEPGLLFSGTTSRGFIGAFQDLSAADISPERVREGMSHARDTFELGAARFNLHAPVALKDRLEWPFEYAFYLEGEGAGAVSLPNPARAELNTTRIFAGVFRNVFQGNLAEDLYLETALAFGAGSERRETFLDNGSAIARGTEKGITLLAGLDLKVQKVWRFGGGWRLSTTAGTEETAFRLVKKSTEGAVSGKLRSLAHDWQLRNDILYGSFNAHVILGRHPYATRILPRTWNRVSDEANYREFSSQWGIGAGYSVALGSSARLAALAGYYAGAFGGELRLRAGGGTDFRLSSYGVENSSEFRRQSQRTFSFTGSLDI